MNTLLTQTAILAGSQSTPPVNLATRPGASGLEAGPGVCTSENKNPLGSFNRDFTGERFVKRGATVRKGSMLGYVVRVRMGSACVDWAGGTKGSWQDCRWLRVVVV